MDVSKHEALGFLKHLEKTLNAVLPEAAQMEAWLRRTVAGAKGNENEKHLNTPEAAFLNWKALPIIFDTIQTTCGLSKDQARAALNVLPERNTPVATPPYFCPDEPAFSPREVRFPTPRVWGYRAEANACRPNC